MIFGFLAAITGVYSMLIIIRIIISWFGGSVYGKPFALLSAVTDPYLEWWRRNLNFRIGVLDFSAVAGIAALSVIQNILFSLSYSEAVTLGRVLSVVLLSAWSVVSFILVFFLIVIILRLIGYLVNCNMYSPFWRIVDSVSQPLLYRMNRIFFGRRIGGYLKGIIFSSLLLAAIIAVGNYAVPFIAAFLSRLPL